MSVFVVVGLSVVVLVVFVVAGLFVVLVVFGCEFELGCLFVCVVNFV